jgi:class 3 adenylate cyclase/YHS domain-containing protein
MEQDIAILMADLSGYTALTETHGSSTAADLIDKYLAIIKSSLVGDSHLHERTGDEVMIVSASVDDLVSTALMIIKNTSEENNFLQVHGGLHYGKILKRNNSYFGSTINITSRIVSKANPGTFWCSSEFINALANKPAYTFLPKGNHRLKNISEEIGMFELENKISASFDDDPVCRMLVKKNAIKHHHERNLFFCSKDCLDIYTRNDLMN